MADRVESSDERVRTAEVVASMSLATDLGMGLPFEQGLRSTLTTIRLCDVLDVDADTAAEAYYACLLAHVGCTVNAETLSRIFPGGFAKNYHRMYGSPLDGFAAMLDALPDAEAGGLRQGYQVAAGLPKAARFRLPHFLAYCETAEMLAERLGLPPSMSTLFSLITERWDGWGHLRRAKGEDIPLSLRIIQVARDATHQRLLGDDNHVVETIGSRGGHAFDPMVTDAFVANTRDILGAREQPESVWEAVLAAEPRHWLTLSGDAIDRALAAAGAFADLVSPHLSGHSRGVGDLAGTAARLLGMADGEAEMVRRAGYVHDVGRVAVHPQIWEIPGPLTVDDWEQVRLHPYHTERVLRRSSFLSRFAETACSHHERLDGSGYHRAIGASALPRYGRLLAAADAYKSKTEPRAYRKAHSAERAAAVVAERAREGKLDPEMVAAVVEAAGQKPPPVERPAGLTEREVQVIGLLARGLQTKQIARALDISPKTADRHIQNAYRKMGVSTRAAATLVATEHGLVDWGELPISG